MKSSMTNLVISFKPSSMNMAAHDTFHRRKRHHLHRTHHSLLKENFPKCLQLNIIMTYPQSSSSFKDKEGAINLNRSPSERSLVLTQQEQITWQDLTGFFLS
ncbi:hypothetical protein HI914_01983 [Erysiphe necator]|nr:hypothetical protein HI914_01983 [Erysiphe necator]